jgi:hypothetical protein
MPGGLVVHVRFVLEVDVSINDRPWFRSYGLGSSRDRSMLTFLHVCQRRGVEICGLWIIFMLEYLEVGQYEVLKFVVCGVADQNKVNWLCHHLRTQLVCHLTFQMLLVLCTPTTTSHTCRQNYKSTSKVTIELVKIACTSPICKQWFEKLRETRSKSKHVTVTAST